MLHDPSLVSVMGGDSGRAPSCRQDSGTRALPDAGKPTSVDSAVNLKKTKPDLVLHPYAYRAETAIGFNIQKEPWSDIRVRQALSLAIDHESIAENYMQGWGDASPQGATGANVIGYAVPVRGVARGDPAILSV